MDLFSLISIAIIGIIGFLSVCEIKGRGIRARLEARRTPKPMAATDYLTDPPKTLDYGYIDFLERELKVGKYDPDRIALGFDDTEQKPKPLDPEVDDLPMPDAVEANEGCPCAACRSGRRDAKPVDDSWADVDVRDGVYEPEPRGLVRRIVDNNGNWTEIRSFGS